MPARTPTSSASRGIGAGPDELVQDVEVGERVAGDPGECEAVGDQAEELRDCSTGRSSRTVPRRRA